MDSPRSPVIPAGGAHCEAPADVAIVGSGFGGSLAALALRKQGRSVVLLERGRHPRFAIGESSTPLANLLLEELATKYDLPRLRPLCKWGPWQRTYPEVACGKKRGFSFFAHGDDARERERPLLVAASPHDEIADTHWYRPDVDHFLVREAEAEGATYLDETVLERARFDEDGGALEGRRKGRPVEVYARFVIDASGPRGFLHRALGLPEAPLRWLPATQGLYSHFADVERFDGLFPVDDPPYPVDDAAVHHVFPGGWIWVLRFNNGLTSAGVARLPRGRAPSRRRRARVGELAQGPAACASPVPQGSRRHPFRVLAASRLPERCRHGTAMGPPPFRGRRDRPAAFDWVSPEPAWTASITGLP